MKLFFVYHQHHQRKIVIFVCRQHHQQIYLYILHSLKRCSSGTFDHVMIKLQIEKGIICFKGASMPGPGAMHTIQYGVCRTTSVKKITPKRILFHYISSAFEKLALSLLPKTLYHIQLQTFISSKKFRHKRFTTINYLGSSWSSLSFMFQWDQAGPKYIFGVV